MTREEFTKMLSDELDGALLEADIDCIADKLYEKAVAPLVAEIAALNYVIDKERVESSAKIVALKTENERYL